MKIDECQTIAKQMIDNDVYRDRAFQSYQEMYHLKWSLPDELNKVQWIHKFVSTDPHDAIAAGVRVLSSLTPRIRKHPLAPDQENRKRANEEERILGWHLWAADRKRSRGVVADVVQSALLYDAVALNIVDLENEIGVRKAMGQGIKRLEIARQSGRYVIQVFNPRDVHVKRSSFGSECVLLCQKRLASEVMSEWGNMAKGLKALAEKGEVVTYYDYCDYEYRAVWVGADIVNPNSTDMSVIMKPTEHDMEFLPWVALMGGTSLENEEQHKYHPMLFPMYFSQSWESLNVIRTLRISEAISHASAPRFSDEGPNQQDAYVNYGDPNQIAKPATGNTLKPLAPPPLDNGLGQIAEEIAGDMQRATVSRILMGGDTPSGTAYSTLNLATQTAVGALKPSKELAEKSLAEMFKVMLMWVRHTREPLVAYGNNDRRGDYGENYVIEPDEIDPAALYIDVELSADVPSDRLQRANAASIMVQYGYPREYALEDLGVDDPQTALRQWYFEKFVQAKYDEFIARQQQAIQMEGQMQMQAFQMQMQQQAMAQQQQAQQPQQMPQQMPMQPGDEGSGMPPELMQMMMGGGGPPPGEMNGQGFNPAFGGTPAVIGQAPNDALRELVRGQSLSGEETGYAEV